jgi:hypothetical protein
VYLARRGRWSSGQRSRGRPGAPALARDEERGDAPPQVAVVAGSGALGAVARGDEEAKTPNPRILLPLCSLLAALLAFPSLFSRAVPRSRHAR